MLDLGTLKFVTTDPVPEVLEEFAPVFSYLGVPLAKAEEFVGGAWRSGLLPCPERGAELLEELAVVVTEGTARDVVEALGLSFEEMQAKVGDGRGVEAIKELAGALVESGDCSRLVTGIFSGAAGPNPDAVVGLLAETLT